MQYTYYLFMGFLSYVTIECEMGRWKGETVMSPWSTLEEHFRRIQYTAPRKTWRLSFTTNNTLRTCSCNTANYIRHTKKKHLLRNSSLFFQIVYVSMKFKDVTVSFYEVSACRFFVRLIMGKCTSRHLCRYGKLFRLAEQRTLGSLFP